MPEIIRCILISGPFSSGKSVFALSYASATGLQGDVVSFDSDNSQQYYIADGGEGPDELYPKKLKFKVHRVTVPNMEEVQAIIQKIRHPDTPVKELLNPITQYAFDAKQLGPEARSILKGINDGAIKPKCVIFDTVTRPCDQSAQNSRRAFDERYGTGAYERMGPLMWGAAKEVVGETINQCIGARLHVIMTAWPKNFWDPVTKKPTKILVPDVFNNVWAFPNLAFMLVPQKRALLPNGRPGPFVPPKATVLKSQIEAIPEGFTFPKATWEDIFAVEPVFVPTEHAEGDVPETTAEEEART